MLLDVRRTPNLEEGQEEVLAAVLAAYCSRRAAAAGTLFDPYVQGMHMLAACPLWVGLDRAQALAVFEFALERLCGGYYSDNSFGLFKRDVLVAEALIEERLPRLAAALRSASVPTMSIAFDPLLCLFTNHLPPFATLRFWDLLLLEGDAAVFAVLLALLEGLLPEAAPPACSQEETVTKWDGFPFVERFHERSSALSAEDVEATLGRARGLLEGPEVEDGGGLRRRLHELRRYGVPESDAGGQEGCVGAWWGQMRGWWEDDGTSAKKPTSCRQM